MHNILLLVPDNPRNEPSSSYEALGCIEQRSTEKCVPYRITPGIRQKRVILSKNNNSVPPVPRSRPARGFSPRNRSLSFPWNYCSFASRRIPVRPVPDTDTDMKPIAFLQPLRTCYNLRLSSTLLIRIQPRSRLADALSLEAGLHLHAALESRRVIFLSMASNPHYGYGQLGAPVKLLFNQKNTIPNPRCSSG